MHLSLTFFDSEDAPRSFRLELTSWQAEPVMNLRILQAIKLSLGANRVTTDNLSNVQHPPLEQLKARDFEAAFLSLYLNAEAFRDLMAKPELFPVLIKRHLPKDKK